MTFAANPLNLPGAMRDDGPLRLCNYCENHVPTGGGVQATPTRWKCAACWKSANFRRKMKERS